MIVEDLIKFLKDQDPKAYCCLLDIDTEEDDEFTFELGEGRKGALIQIEHVYTTGKIEHFMNNSGEKQYGRTIHFLS